MLPAVPIARAQFLLFDAFALIFVILVVRAMIRKRNEAGETRETRSRLGVVLQSAGIALVCFGPVRPILAWPSLPAIAGVAAVCLLMGLAIFLFVSSSNSLGKNWSIEARTRKDHELVRTGPYARMRHPIYLAMLLFLLGLTVALGHWVQLLLALPLFLAGTRIRITAEDGLLEQGFGDTFRAYKSSVPALFPKIS